MTNPASSSTALSVISPTGHTLPAWMGGITAALPEALAAGKVIIDSGFGPKDCKGPASIVVAVAMGARLGLDPFTAIHGIAVVNGRPSLFGDALLAVCQNHPSWEDFVEEWTGKKYDDDFTAHCTVLRKGRKPKTETFSVADAKKAALWGKQGPWSAQPQRMMMMRARAFALRGAFGDALAGFHSREEMDDAEPREVEATVHAEPKPAKRRTVAVTDPLNLSAAEQVKAEAEAEAQNKKDEPAAEQTQTEVKTLGEHVAEAQPAPKPTTARCQEVTQALMKRGAGGKALVVGIMKRWKLTVVTELDQLTDDDRQAYIDEVTEADAKLEPVAGGKA